MSDEALVKAIVVTKDTMLFEVLYDRYSGMVYNKCYGFSSSADEAKDLTQDIFLKVYVKLASFKGKSKFSTWLYAFTYNHCVNYVNRNTAKKIEKQSIDTKYLSNVSDDADSTVEFDNMRAEQLKQVMDMISPKEKMILLMKYQDDMSVKELADVLEVGESAIKMRLKRAKAKLIEKYEIHVSNGESI